MPICVDRRRFALAMAAAAAGLPLAARTSAATRDMAHRAYIWGYSSIDLYAILRAQALHRTSSEFKAPLNAIGHARNVATVRERGPLHRAEPDRARPARPGDVIQAQTQGAARPWSTLQASLFRGF